MVKVTSGVEQVRDIMKRVDVSAEFQLPLGTIDRAMLELFLRAHLRELESQIDEGSFDWELSARIDCTRFLIEG